MENSLRCALSARFGRFAAGHFLLSVCSCAVWIGVLVLFIPHLPGPELVPLPYILLNAVLIGAYFPIGAYTAARQLWPRPSGWTERILAVLLPALAAWLWEGLVLALSNGIGRTFTEMAVTLLSLSFFLAFPSALFVFFCTLYGLLGPLWSGRFFLVTGLAGLLPPLLFAAGSFWQAWRAWRRRPPDCRGALST